MTIADSLPTTPTGKLDLRALPATGASRRHVGTAFRAPETPAELTIAAIWRDVLRVDEVGVDDDIFELGGHSLAMVRIAAQLQAGHGMQVSVQDLIANPTIGSLARLVAAGQGTRSLLMAIKADPAAVRAPLTYQQEQVWFLGKLAPESIAYHAQTTIRITGPFDADVLDRTITEITRRHAILRTTFEEVDGAPCQFVHPAGPVRADQVELSEEALEDFVQGLLEVPFEPSRLPLVRWTLVKIGAEEHELILVEHHLVHDGWSFALLMREFTTLYNAYAVGTAPALRDPAIQYADYARWQRAQLRSPAIAAQLAYWIKRLSEPLPPLALPYDRARPKVQTFGGQTLRVELPAGLPGSIRRFCRQERTTLFTVMYAAFAVLLHRYTGERDICAGSAIACRQQPETHNLLGMLVNTVVLRCQVSGRASFRKIVRQARDVVIEAAANQELPFSEVVRALNPDRDLAGNPLTQILFSANDSPLPDLDLAGARGTIFERGNGSAKMDLDVVVIPREESRLHQGDEHDDRITLLWEYNVDLFDEATMWEMIGGYLRLLDAAVTEPDQLVADLPLLSDQELRQVLRDWNPPMPDREFVPVQSAIAAQARKTPDALAVKAGRDFITYATLLDRAGRVAAMLRRLGTRPGAIIGICLPRGIDLVVAELGVLMAGAAYLPMDPDNPPRRLAYVISDAAPRCTITIEEFRDRLPATAAILRLDQTAGIEPMPARPVGAADAAYAIYTSGSTGQPKGVLVQHASLANLVWWRQDAYQIRPGDRMTMFASPGFDPTVSDIWPTLAAGASVHVPATEIRMLPHRLQEWLLSERITMAELPTPLAESLMLLPWPRQCPFRLLIAGGDRLHLRPAPHLPFQLSNEYGPTENTATSTWEIVRSDEPAPNPPIGRPVTGTHCYVLDSEMQLVPPRAIGELYLGGAGMARGYLRRPELTADLFVPHPFPPVPGARLYRTGDQVRRLRDGRLEFLGRVDTQIKLRGFRIEPGEIVAALRGHPDIEDAYVTTDGRRLIGYLVTADRTRPSPERLRARLARDLPGYMVPTAFVYLDELPKSASGKVDRRALPAPTRSRTEPEQPATEIEAALGRIWRDVLGIDHISPTENFFDLGGHSLLLGQVHYRLVNELGQDLAMVTLFEHPTIRTLAGFLGTGTSAATSDAERRGRARTNARSQVDRRRAMIRAEEP